MKTPDFSCSFPSILVRSPQLFNGFSMGRLFLGLTLAAALFQSASAQPPVATDPVGFLQPFNTQANQINLLANSDTLVSIPFTRSPAFTGAIASVSGNVITVSGSPGWTTSPQQFVYAPGTQPNHYYALIGPGTSNPKEGHFYNITANGVNTLTVNLGSDNLTGIPANAQVIVLPHWTLNTIFPSTDQNVSFTPTTSTRSFKTQVLIPDYTDAGVNLAPTKTYYFINSGANVGWRDFNDATTTDHGNDVVVPNGYFVVRNQNGASGGILTTTGAVLTKKFTIPLVTQSNQSQDNAVSMSRPVPVSLNNTGLNPADGSFVATTSTRSFKDQLFVYDNTQVGFNKSPVKTYYYIASDSNGHSGWRDFNDATTTDHGNDLIAAGSAITIRKVAASGQPVFWTNGPTY